MAPQQPAAEPVLIMHGTADKATVCRGSEYFHEHAGSSDNHAHDLLNDIGNEEVFADIAGWIEERLPAAQRKAAAAE